MCQRNDFWIFLILTILIPAQITAQELAVVPEAKPINHIVAVVNEDVITRHELDEAKKTAISRMQQQGMQIPDRHT